MIIKKRNEKSDIMFCKGLAGRFCGFTLVELMIVLVIMVILAAAAVPLFSGYVKRAQEAVCITNLSSVSQRVMVERMMVPNLDADAVRKVIEDEIGGKKLCPNGGNYLVEKSADSIVVYCDYHGKTPPQVVGDRITELMAQGSVVRNEIDKYFNRPGSSNNLDSTGPNFGGDLKKTIAKQLNISEKFEMRIWWDRSATKEYEIYIFDPVDGKTAGDVVSVARYKLDKNGELKSTEQGTAGLVQSNTENSKGENVKFLTLDGASFKRAD